MPNTVQFVDLTLRDGQQSLAATRMTTAQGLEILPLLKDAGFAALELWGGAVLDSCIRFLNEDPWERLDRFYAAVGQACPIRMLLRGQNLFAYQPFPDDLVIAFVKEAVRAGVGVIRVFDALNDWRNLELSLIATKAYGGLAEAALSYTVSPVHTTDYFISLAQKLEDEGADRIAIKDMAGLLEPPQALDLFRALKARLRAPVVFHSHTTTGVATFNALLAMREGIDMIDTAITPFAGGASHPPIEVLVTFAEALGVRHTLNKRLLERIQARLFELYHTLRPHIPSFGQPGKPVRFKDIDRALVKRIVRLVERAQPEDIAEGLTLTRQLLRALDYPPYDDAIFQSQIPGGMLTNLHSQLSAMGQLDKLDAIMAEIPAVRADVGYVPLVTPTSQIVGSQATFNVLLGRYAMISNEFKMLLRGEFGKTPVPPRAELVEQVLGPDEPPLRYRPASYLLPVLEDSYDLPFVKSQRDLLLYLMLKQPAEDFLRAREGLV